jgi:nucleoside-diphosphate kinase
MTNKERTLILLKPDTVQRGLIGKIITRFEEKGLKIVALKMIAVDQELARSHYVEHLEKPFFSELLQFITAAPVVAMALEGEQAVAVARTLMGATNPFNAQPGTIRGDFGLNLTKNIIHGSDSLQSAARELETFFGDQLLDYDLSLDEWVQ